MIPRTRAVTLLVVALVVLGVGLRVWVLASPLGEVDADEAVVGLMAEDALGGHFRAFFWGQHYGGTHESLVAAGLLGLGLPRDLALKLTSLAFFAAGALLVWRIGRRVVGEVVGETGGETAGRLAGALFFAAPAGVVWMSTKERGFYGAALVFGLAAVLLVLRLDERWTARDALLLGLAAGSAWYASPQSVYVLAPAGVWLFVRTARRRHWSGFGRAVPWVLGGAVAGALPWLVANLGSGFASLEAPGGIPDTSYLDRLELFFRRGLPLAFGLRNPVFSPWVLGRAGPVLYLLVLVALAALVAFAIRRRARLSGGLWLVVAGAAAYPFVFAAFPTSYAITDVRYVTMLVPFLAVLVGWALARAHPTVLVAAVLGIGALSVVGTADAIEVGDTPGLWDIAPGDLDPLVAALRHEHVDRVFADYWIAHRIDFETGEDIVAAPLEVVRYEPYEQTVRRDPAPAWVMFRGTAQERRLGLYLDRHAVPFDRVDAGIHVVYLPGERVLPEQVAEVWARARE